MRGMEDTHICKYPAVMLHAKRAVVYARRKLLDNVANVFGAVKSNPWVKYRMQVSVGSEAA